MKDTPDRLRSPCKRCGGFHEYGCKRRTPGSIDWAAVMAYRVKSGQEMTLEEIGAVAGCSRERIRQVEFSALRKLAGRPAVKAAVNEALRS